MTIASSWKDLLNLASPSIFFVVSAHGVAGWFQSLMLKQWSWDMIAPKCCVKEQDRIPVTNILLICYGVWCPNSMFFQHGIQTLCEVTLTWPGVGPRPSQATASSNGAPKAPPPAVKSMRVLYLIYKETMQWDGPCFKTWVVQHDIPYRCNKMTQLFLDQWKHFGYGYSTSFFEVTSGRDGAFDESAPAQHTHSCRVQVWILSSKVSTSWIERPNL